MFCWTSGPFFECCIRRILWVANCSVELINHHSLTNTKILSMYSIPRRSQLYCFSWGTKGKRLEIFIFHCTIEKTSIKLFEEFRVPWVPNMGKVDFPMEEIRCAHIGILISWNTGNEMALMLKKVSKYALKQNEQNFYIWIQCCGQLVALLSNEDHREYCVNWNFYWTEILHNYI